MKPGKRAKRVKKWNEPRRFPRQMPIKNEVASIYSQMLTELVEEGVERDAYNTIMEKQERCREINNAFR